MALIFNGRLADHCPILGSAFTNYNDPGPSHMNPDRTDVRHLTSARQDLQRWQSAQRAHDETYHPEIAKLQLSQRIAHLVLHMSKYAGGLMSASIESDDAAFRKQLVDAGIIAVSASTALKIDLARHFESAGHDVSVSFDDLSKGLAAALGQGLIIDFVMEVGRLAKAAEAVDHMEAFPIRETWTQGFPKILGLVMGEAVLKGIDLRREAAKRLQAIRTSDQFSKSEVTGLSYDFLER